jgi:hypothetical protein
MSHPPSHRGAAPKDERWFGPKAIPVLRAGLTELCWLLDRGYALRSSTVLVGDRHCLTARQRTALARCASTAEAAQRRDRRRVSPEAMSGRELWLDGFNVLTILESALAGGIILVGRDGCCRDVAGVHRRYRKVQETLPALQTLGEVASAWQVGRVRWWLDAPVSNSGRLRTLILETAARSGWPWEAELVPNPDRVLSRTDQVVATSDCVILDRCQRWVNLAQWVISRRLPRTRLVDFSAGPSQAGTPRPELTGPRTTTGNAGGPT